MTVKVDGTVTFQAPSSADYIALDTNAVNGYKSVSPLQDPEVKAIVDAALLETGTTFSEIIGSTSN